MSLKRADVKPGPADCLARNYVQVLALMVLAVWAELSYGFVFGIHCQSTRAISVKLDGNL